MGAATAAIAEGDAGRGCGSGAVGGVTGEIVADWVRDSLMDGDIAALASGAVSGPNGETLVIDSGKLAGALAIFVVGGDVNIGSMTGENAARYNALGLLKKAYKVGRLLVTKLKNGEKLEVRDVIDALWSVEDVQTLLSADATGADRLLSAIMLAVDWWVPLTEAMRGQLADPAGERGDNLMCRFITYITLERPGSVSVSERAACPSEGRGMKKDRLTFLAVDRNENGVIDVISDRFGAPDVSGFIELAVRAADDDGILTREAA